MLRSATAALLSQSDMHFDRFRMHAARVVADHCADRATIMRRRIGSKRKPMRRSVSAKIVERDAGPRSGQPFRRIDCKKAVEVFWTYPERPPHCSTGSQDTRAAAARKYGRTVRVGGENCLCAVFAPRPVGLLAANLDSEAKEAAQIFSRHCR
jgi:hypothetical protein